MTNGLLLRSKCACGTEALGLVLDPETADAAAAGLISVQCDPDNLNHMCSPQVVKGAAR
jgi:hypothetical protein